MADDRPQRDYAAMSLAELRDLIRNGDLGTEEMRLIGQVLEVRRQQLEAEAIAIGAMPPAGAQPQGQTPQVHPVTGRPILENPDGTFATEETITIEDGNGGWVNIPTIINGQRVGEAAAEDAYRQGRNPAVGGPFSTVEQAVTAAQARSRGLGDALMPHSIGPGPATMLPPNGAPLPDTTQQMIDHMTGGTGLMPGQQAPQAAPAAGGWNPAAAAQMGMQPGPMPPQPPQSLNDALIQMLMSGQQPQTSPVMQQIMAQMMAGGR